MSKRRIIDGVAIVWLAVWGYMAAIGAGPISLPGQTLFWIASPLLLLPSLVWLGWSIYQKEGTGPARITTQSAAFGAGVILFLIQIPQVAQALSQIL